MLEQLIEYSKGVYEPIPIAGTSCYLIDGALVHHDEIYPPEDRIMGMAGFSSVDQVVNALTTGKGQRLEYQKNSFTTVANQIYDYWLAGGNPSAGTFGTALTGTIPVDSTTPGGLIYTNPTGPATMHGISLGGISTVGVGTLMLYDRVAEYPINGTVTSGTFGTQPALTRDANGSSPGAGVYMFVENVGATANTAQVLTITYTNSAGTGSRSTGGQTLQVGAISTNRVINPSNQWWFPLQAGDRGVRSLQSYTLGASAISTTINIVLARPIAWLPIMGAAAGIERDLVYQLPTMPRLFDDTSLSFLLMANTTTCPLNGYVQIAEN